MLVLLRLFFGFALFAVLAKAANVAGRDETVDALDAGYVALAVLVGIANAIVWAPFVGRLMADPLTGAFTTGHVGEMRNHVLQFANKLAARGWRRWALCFAFIEGVRHPDMPGAFVLGLKQARRGSCLEKVFAREVWRFDNAEHCLHAWKALRNHGVELGVHRRPEVNLLVHAVTRERLPDPEALAVPAAPPPPPLQRNSRIRLFPGASEGQIPNAGSAAEQQGATPGVEGPMGTANASDAAAEGAIRNQAMPCDKAGERPLRFMERMRVLLTGRYPK
jgi:hypothetical protein